MNITYVLLGLTFFLFFVFNSQELAMTMSTDILAPAILDIVEELAVLI